MLAVALAGSRLVAAGWRGLVVYSDDEGRTWRQADVPVSTDLVSLSFPTPAQGWAVGHGGVVLHTQDGGATWSTQVHGSALSTLTERHFAEKPSLDSPAVQRAVTQAKQATKRNATPSLLDVYFESEKVGYVVGTFNSIFRTDDGGKTWTPWMDRTDNEQELHFNAVRGHASGIYLAGEQGTVWRMAVGSNRFIASRTGYAGTLFGLTIDDAQIVAFGMRGSILRSGDQARTWARVQAGSRAGICAGRALPGGEIALAAQDGSLALSRDGGRSFSNVRPSVPMPYFGMTVVDAQRVALAGAAGVRLEKVGS
jgi:photosystem II stability/assembly factor-like uncharacterized protein